MAQRDTAVSRRAQHGARTVREKEPPDMIAPRAVSAWPGRLRAAALGIALALLALYPQDAMQAARSACAIWASGVMPALFPYMVFSQMLATAIRAPFATAPLSMLGGSPAGARLIALKEFSPARAQRMAALCATASPLYILGTLNGGWRMLLAHWLGAAVAWVFVRLWHTAPEVGDGNASPPVRVTLPEAIRDASLAMVGVCGCMALFSVLTALLSRLLPLAPPLSALLACVLEMATGCARIQAAGLPVAQAAPLLCAAVSFGGLSIFMQNAAYLRPSGVDLRIQLLARIVHAAAAFGACALFYLS